MEKLSINTEGPLVIRRGSARSVPERKIREELQKNGYDYGSADLVASVSKHGLRRFRTVGVAETSPLRNGGRTRIAHFMDLLEDLSD